jgi:hypothetical protein
MGGFPIADMSRLGEVGHIQVAARGDPGQANSLSWPRKHTLGIMDPCPQPHWAHTGETKDKIYIFCLKCPIYLKLKFELSKLWHLTKRQKDSLPEFFCRVNKAFRFFH